MQRRAFFELAMVTAAAAAIGCAGPSARARRRHRRRVRRRIRRRIRRRVVWRMIGARRVVVVPVAVAVGWELSIDARVVVVHELRPDVLIVVDAQGARQELPYLREDDDANRVEQQGSQLDASDTSSPARETDEYVDEDVED